MQAWSFWTGCQVLGPVGVALARPGSDSGVHALPGACWAFAHTENLEVRCQKIPAIRKVVMKTDMRTESLRSTCDLKTGGPIRALWPA